MLEAVGTGVAMGNAKDEIKATPPAKCRSVEEDGVYDFCLGTWADYNIGIAARISFTFPASTASYAFFRFLS